MKKPNITPGPWKWDGTNRHPKRSCYLQGADYETIGSALDGFGDNPADMKAIAALPQLLAALEKAYERTEAEYEGLRPEVVRALHREHRDEYRAALEAAGYQFPESTP